MILFAQNLAAQRGGETLFHQLDFTLESQQLMTITGQNGAGKSTLLRMIAGLLNPSQGVIGLDDGGIKFKVAAGCHYLGTQNAMKAILSVEDNLKFWIKFQGAPNMPPEQALEILELQGIEHLPYSVLSTGQKRRVAIARLMVSYRPVWIIDEPTTGLDEHASQIFATIMQHHLQSGGMIVAATHLPLGLKETRHIALEDYFFKWEIA